MSKHLIRLAEYAHEIGLVDKTSEFVNQCGELLQYLHEFKLPQAVTLTIYRSMTTRVAYANAESAEITYRPILDVDYEMRGIRHDAIITIGNTMGFFIEGAEHIALDKAIRALTKRYPEATAPMLEGYATDPNYDHLFNRRMTNLGQPGFNGGYGGTPGMYGGPAFGYGGPQLFGRPYDNNVDAMRRGLDHAGFDRAGGVGGPPVTGGKLHSLGEPTNPDGSLRDQTQDGGCRDTFAAKGGHGVGPEAD